MTVSKGVKANAKSVPKKTVKANAKSVPEKHDVKTQFIFITKIRVLHDLRINPILLEKDEIDKLIDEYIPPSNSDRFILYPRENGININHQHILPL